MVRGWILWLLCLGAFLVTGEQVRAETRIALIVGNASYSSIGSLPNADADAQLMAVTLEQLGFDTTLLMNADQRAMKEAIAIFGRKLRTAGPEAAGLFYYAGHGIQSRDRNYLMPIDSAPVDAADLDLMGVEANWVLAQMESAGNRTNIIVLDACRNNPFAVENRSINRGLARIEPPTGSFVAYATAPGSVAVDGDGANSPFTAALATAMTEPGVAIEQVFKKVRVEVIRETNGQQTPWDSSSLVHDFYFAGQATPVAPEPVEQNLWETVRASEDPGRIALFLQLYPNSRFAEDARALLAEAMAMNPELLTGDETSEGGTAQAAAAWTEAPKDQAPPAPVLSEEEMIALAAASPSIQAYADYLTAYPDGTFVDLAKAEIAALIGQTGTETAALASPPDDGPVRFDQPLAEGGEAVIGWSLQQLAKGKPSHPPFEGLPDAAWKGQTCANCHAWTQQALCDQGSFYIGKDPLVLERIPHPYGGPFKGALLRWAQDGCN